MRKLLFLLPFTMCCAFFASAQNDGVSINANGTAPDPSAALDISYSNKGVLIPRLSSAERNAIPNPSLGLQIFNTTTNCLNFWTGTGWRQLCGDCEFNTGSNQNSPVATNDGPICDAIGATLHLYASTIIDATYQWTGPNGFTSTEQNPVITDIYWPNAGTYSVTATSTANGCVSAPGTTEVVVNQTPWGSFGPATAFFNNDETFIPTMPGWESYSWEFAGGIPATSTALNPSVTWSEPGTYDVTLTMTSSGCDYVVTNQVVVSPDYGYSGDVQTFTVPDGVTSLNLECWGAEGGRSSSCGPGTAAAGKGGYASGTLAVTPGATVYIYVGGQGSPVVGDGYGGGGYNGGADGHAGYSSGGGGATDIRIGGTTLAHRVLVAGGGGGIADPCGSGSVAGGDGGGNVGGNGADGNLAGLGGGGGQGGTQSAGGAGGSPGSGEPGTLGNGGRGGVIAGFGFSGGGGGGYYGGGGGGGGAGDGNGGVGVGGGGGGGSSYTGGVTGGTSVAGVRSGHGMVSISY